MDMARAIPVGVQTSLQKVSGGTRQLHNSKQEQLARQAVRKRKEERNREEGGNEDRRNEATEVRGRENEKVAETVTDWVTVQRKTKRRTQTGKLEKEGSKMVQIFVKMDGPRTIAK